jgi:hypothetical protein
MTPGQAVEAIALAHVKAPMPQPADTCNTAKIAFKDRESIVSFTASIPNLSF